MANISKWKTKLFFEQSNNLSYLKELYNEIMRFWELFFQRIFFQIFFSTEGVKDI